MNPLHLSFFGGEYELFSTHVLYVLLLAPLFLFFTLRSLADLPWTQRLLSLFLRLLFVFFLALGLGKLSKIGAENKICTVFLIDVSDSISDEDLEEAERNIKKAITYKKSKDELVKVISFAKNAKMIEINEEEPTSFKIQRHKKTSTPPTENKSSFDFDGDDDGSASDLSQALQLALGLYPHGYLRRAVIMSDGNETEGDLLSTAVRAGQFGVKVFILPTSKGPPGEVLVRDLHLPNQVKVGEPFELQAILFSNRAQSVHLTLKQGEAINGLDGLRDVAINKGETSVMFKSVVRVPGEVTYTLTLDHPKEDHFQQNNSVSSSIVVPGKPLVLYVEGQEGRASYLARALSAQDFDVDVRSPRSLPTDVREMERYDFVIVSDVPKELVSTAQEEVIELYVRDIGGGFLFAGGQSGFGLGGWSHSLIERLLPVRMDAEKKKDEPQIAMVLVIDRSGSMAGLPLEMAKAAAKATADVLAGEDLLEVIGFDAQPDKVVRMTRAKHRSRIQGDIARIAPGGGTEIFSALDAAYQSLSVTEARRKHALLLTDGQAPQQGIKELVQTMASQGMTVSSVALGTEADDSLLRTIADLGGGRFYKVLDARSLPRVFTRETELISRNSAIETPFQPMLVQSASFMAGIDVSQAPLLRGYVATKMKPSPAQELLAAPNGEAILARSRVGLGQVLAWTSDVKNLWAVEWLRWPLYGQFWGQLVREHMKTKKKQQFDLKTHIDPVTGYAVVQMDAMGPDDRFQNGLSGKITMKPPHLRQKEQEKIVDMPQVAPGLYEARFPLTQYGSYLFHATLETQDLKAQNQMGGDEKTKITLDIQNQFPRTQKSPQQVAEAYGQLSNPYPREYMTFGPNLELLTRVAKETKGSKLELDSTDKLWDAGGEHISTRKELWPKLVFAAIPIYLLDLLLRRVRLFGSAKNLSSPGRSPLN